jgi:Sec-independent protein secretion pathway component TatC
MPDVLSIFLLAFAALIIIGPRRLPESLEALWLAVTDYSRVQRGLPPLGSLHNARIFWTSEKNNVYAFIKLLGAVAEHLEELRRRLLVSILVLGVAFLVAFFFAQQLLALIIHPISSAPFKTGPDAPVNDYVLASDTKITTQIAGPTGPISATITIPAGTPLPLTLPSPKPVFLHPTELFSTYVKIAGMAALGLSLPVLIWELLLFLRGPKFEEAQLSRKEWEKRRAALSGELLAVAEQRRKAVYQGLTAREVRPMYFLVPLAGVFFVAGILFTYFIILPSALDFLFGLGGDLVQPLPSLDDYIGFALALIFWVGLSFETPLVMFFLARFKLITWQQFARQWRYAVVIIVVIAAVITPTTDAFNMTLVALPMFLLYAIGVGLARFA